MRGKLPTLALAAAVVMLTLSLVIYPKESLEAAKDGMNLFFTVVFPSLLPFFILSEMMLGLGVVHFIGVLFTPLMRPLFNVPGEGAFVLSMGLAAGFPMDAVITARFRRGNMCTRVEGERMLAFSNTADPLFIWGAVAVGMFGMPALGGTMALAHYIAALLVGLTFRFYGLNETEYTPEPRREGSMLSRAVQALIRARREDGRPVGQMLGDAITDSVKTMALICGYIILFSTIARMIDVSGVFPYLAAPFESLFRLFGIDPALVRAAVTGLLEVDLGTLAASRATGAPLVQQVAVAGAIIGWSGLSVHGQVASVLTGTDIRMGPYVAARLLHAVLAFIATLVLLPTARIPGLGMARVLPALGGLPDGLWRVSFLDYLVRGAGWSLAVPLGLALVGVTAAALTGGLRWAYFYARR
ncbi:sporulation integral membrane protein YlbJ [Symbiobacterium terraclitae]|uniref:Sporulation integral membrane protein YlbJ n=1 Tax=Symbiobacterium terraclitae TaxID=557451 RepID=A0ABS4JU93_9FIRM|nr:sporulation integral membrane protein YlbJ [Symbiobacterium terraclitae]MBP2019124.1 sporulation integral membrane protein YlbJ [Symbiobacterium terraclitae]